MWCFSSLHQFLDNSRPQFPTKHLLDCWALLWWGLSTTKQTAPLWGSWRGSTPYSKGHGSSGLGHKGPRNLDLHLTRLPLQVLSLSLNHISPAHFNCSRTVTICICITAFQIAFTHGISFYGIKATMRFVGSAFWVKNLRLRLPDIPKVGQKIGESHLFLHQCLYSIFHALRSRNMTHIFLILWPMSRQDTQ